jgi:NAD-dependent dihydropyrimidine dehydrogenase PreA subunit
MHIDPEKCVGCAKCVPLCCGEAIQPLGEKYIIDQEKCVECYLCLTSGICPVDAFEEVQLTWPRILRHTFSSVCAAHKGTGIEGRGTEEMKTNDVTGRYRRGEVGFTVDVGRPGVGTTFEDVEKIAMAVARVGVEFEKINPTTRLMVDVATGRLRDDIKRERVLSCILEFKTHEANLLSIVNTLRNVATRVNTVFSVGCICRCRPDGTPPVKAVLDKEGIFYRPNGKTNIGIGRPLSPY